jgi:hypothetical protein
LSLVSNDRLIRVKRGRRLHQTTPSFPSNGSVGRHKSACQTYGKGKKVRINGNILPKKLLICSKKRVIPSHPISVATKHEVLKNGMFSWQFFSVQTDARRKHPGEGAASEPHCKGIELK